jgi:hypothetical protein
MRFILIAIVVYLVIRYLLRPILVALLVKSANKMMQDMQNRQQGGAAVNPDQGKSSKNSKEVAGEYIDYEEVK